MMTGIILSPSFWVLALNCLQNSIILTPCWPKEGPTGGAGLALPAGICNLICAETSFAISFSFSLATENSHHLLYPTMVLFDFVNDAVEPKEGTIDDANVVTFDKFDRLTRLGLSRIDLFEQRLHFLIGQRSRNCASTDKSCNFRCLL